VHVLLLHPFGWLLGFVLFGGLALGVWRAYVLWGETGAWAAGAGGVVIVTALLNLAMKFVPRTKFGRGLVLDDKDKPLSSIQTTQNTPEGATQEEVHKPLLGRTGITRTRLRPSGFIEIDDRRIDVVADGVSIDSGEQVEIVSVAGNRVVVRRTDT